MPCSPVRRAVAVASLTAVFTLPLSASASADVGDEDVVRVRFTGVTKEDSRPQFVEPGASWVTHEHLYSLKKRFIGDAGARCTASKVEGNRLTSQCTRVLRLKKGTLTLSDMITRKYQDSLTGLFADPRAGKPVTAKTAIVGGTGIYNDAEGEGYITLESDRVHYDLYIDD